MILAVSGGEGRGGSCVEWEWKRFLVPALASLAAAAGLSLVRSLAFRLMRRWAEGTGNRGDDIFINVFQLPSFYWIIAIGLSVGVQVPDLPDRHVFSIGKTIQVLIILSVIGISVTPILTALGVGGLAVALALQDTLSNLFAGAPILMEKPIRAGDFIRLETGREGYVVDIAWRTTRIWMLTNNLVVIPNSKIAQSTLTNYHLPESGCPS